MAWDPISGKTRMPKSKPRAARAWTPARIAQRKASRRLAAQKRRRAWAPEYRAQRAEQVAEWRARHLVSELERYLYWRFMFLARRDEINQRRNASRASKRAIVHLTRGWGVVQVQDATE
jgi:hypothetical protein